MTRPGRSCFEGGGNGGGGGGEDKSLVVISGRRMLSFRCIENRGEWCSSSRRGLILAEQTSPARGKREDYDCFVWEVFKRSREYWPYLGDLSQGGPTGVERTKGTSRHHSTANEAPVPSFLYLLLIPLDPQPSPPPPQPSGFHAALHSRRAGAATADLTTSSSILESTQTVDNPPSSTMDHFDFD